VECWGRSLYNALWVSTLRSRIVILSFSPLSSLFFILKSVEDLVELIITNKYEFHADPWDHISAPAKDLIKRCLTKNTKERITPTDALMHPWIAHTKANTNILPHVVFENLRKSMNRLSKKKVDHGLPGMIRSKSGKCTEVKCFDEDEEEEGENEEEEDEIIEVVGRRAISYADELNNANCFQFMTNKQSKKIKNVKSNEVFFTNIKEEEVKKDYE